MKRLLHLPEEAINKDIPKCNCFWVPSYDLFASARTAVVSGRSNLPQKSLVNSPFWTKVWTPPINISWIRPCFLKAVWLENIDEQNLQPDTLNDKGHPQATSCKPIYHGKPVICNFCSHSAKPAWRLQTKWYGKLCRSVVQGADEVGTEYFVSVDFLIQPKQYANTCMVVLIIRVTWESLFSYWGQKKVVSCKIYLRGLRPCFFHCGSERFSFFELRPSQQPF